MLVLTRGVGDRIVIGDGIVLTVVRVGRNRAQIGIQAPRATAVRRAEKSPIAEAAAS